MNAPSNRPPVVLAPEQHAVLETWGVRVVLLATAADTGGRHAVIDYTSPPTGLGPPLHLHREAEESFLILEGSPHFQVADRRIVATPGTFLHVPAGTPHAFWNVGPGPARFVITFSPAGLENYFVELFHLARTHPVPTLDIRPLIAQIGDRYDQVVLGPSPGSSAR